VIWYTCQFHNKPFLTQLGIKHRLTSIKHPQFNVQVEAANKVKLNELKKKLDCAKSLLVEEIPNMIWGCKVDLYEEMCSLFPSLKFFPKEDFSIQGFN